jgi:ligand-binding sensor domain-containing protein
MPFKVFKNNPADSTTISDNHIKSIYVDDQNSMWVGTSNGLNLYDPKQETFYNVLSKESIQSIIGEDVKYSNEINDIIQDSKGTFWLSTNESDITYQ